jgi:hypothetical protein
MRVLQADVLSMFLTIDEYSQKKPWKTRFKSTNVYLEGDTFEHDVATGGTEQYPEEGDCVDTEYDDENNLEDEGNYELDEDRGDLRDADADQSSMLITKEYKPKHVTKQWFGQAMENTQENQKEKAKSRQTANIKDKCVCRYCDGQDHRGHPEVKS